MNIEEIRKLNKEIEIIDVDDVRFKEYGRVINEVNSFKIVKYSKSEIKIPKDGNIYNASSKILEAFDIIGEIKNKIYGGLEIQVGSCAGQNTKLTGLEYHQGSETIIAVTDCIVMIGKLQDMGHDKFDSKKIETFYVKKGQIVELYATTLHYTPCKVDEDGFITLVILLKGTNTVIEGSNNILLTKKNKYFITHKSQENKVKDGAFPGLIGDIIELKLER